MPTYEYLCACGIVFERILPVARYREPQTCECGAVAQKVILTAPRGYVQGDICYDSPITGEAITSKQKRLEDLAKHDCIEYDPGMRQDADRRQKEQDASLEKGVLQTVEKTVSEMPARKREALYNELKSGADVALERR